MALREVTRSKSESHQLARFLSRLTCRHAALHATGADAPPPRRASGAVLFLDLTDFTPLASRFAARGPEGMEALSELLNPYFHELLETVLAFGGDVHHFFGDALLVLFLEEEFGTTTDALAAALECAIEARRGCHDYPTDEPGTGLGLKATVVAGAMSVIEVHAERTARQVVVLGDAMDDLRALEASSIPGQILVSPRAVGLLPPGGYELRPAQGGHVLIASNWSHAAPWAGVECIPPRDEAVRSYLDPIVFAARRDLELEWIEEFRTVTSLFLKVDDRQVHADTAGRIQQIFSLLAAPVTRHDGSILRFCMEDKGLVLHAAFGVPGHGHANDAARAVSATLEALSSMREEGFNVSAGAATGMQFCGFLGDQSRVEFCVFGEAVNLAARLSATRANGLVIDRVTADAARAVGVAPRELPPFELKGFAEPVPAFLCCADQADAGRAASLAGRRSECLALESAVRAVAAGESRFVVLRGEAGIGKSWLLRHVHAHAIGARLTCLPGGGSELESEVAYHAWRNILLRCLSLPAEADGEQLVNHVRQHCPDVAQSHLPLLAEVLGVPFPDSLVTRELRDEARTRAQQRLLTQIVATTVTAGPCALLIEDAHWLDSASWKLLHALRGRKLPALVVLTLRAGESPAEEELRDAHGEGIEWMTLELLDLEETRELLQGLAGGLPLSEALVAAVHAHAGGHPFFTEEVFFALRDRNALRVRGGVCELDSPEDDLASIVLADSIKATIGNRVDRLSYPEQQTLKVASAIGAVVSVALLRAVTIALGIQEHLRDALERLGSLQFLSRTAGSGQVAFRHAILRDAVYELLPFAQRQRIHRAIIGAFDSHEAVASGSRAAVLAYHCANARMMPEAIENYEAAAKLSVGAGAYRETVRHLGSAQRLARESTIDISRERMASWERLLGEAEFQRGRLSDAREHFEKAARLLGRPRTTNATGVALEIGASALRQVGRRVVGHGPRRQRPRAGDREEEASRALFLRVTERLARMCFFSGDRMAFVHQLLRGLDAAEVTAPTPELAKFLAGAAIVTSVRRFGAFVPDVYTRLAREAADALHRRMSRAEVDFILGARWVGEGNWREASASAGAALAVFEDLEDAQLSGQCLALLADIALYMGNLDDASDFVVRLARVAESSENSQLRLWSVATRLWINRRLGLDGESIALARSIEPAWLHEVRASEGVMVATFRASLAHALARHREHGEAAEVAALSLQGAGSGRSPFFWEFELWSSLAGAFALLWDASDSSVEQQRHEAVLRGAIASLRSLSARLVLAKPDHLLAMGLLEARLGRRRAAIGQLRRAVALSERLGMPYTAGRAWFELARCQPGTAHGSLALEQAATLFARIGARADLAAVHGAQADS